jgi:CRP/FNR family transcriptional regulator, cyclic AMP receptor protein
MTILDLLARVPLFASLPTEALQSLANHLNKRSYKRGDVMVKQGRMSETLYIVLSGTAQVVVQDEQEKEIILAHLRAGDYFGEMSLIDGKPHSASVIADAALDALALGKSELRACMSQHPAVSLSMMQELVRRLREADEKIESLALVDVYGRVVKALMAMAKMESTANLKTAPIGGFVITQKISKSTLGKTIGASREMVTKVFKELEKRGAITNLPSGHLQLQAGIQTLI